MRWLARTFGVVGMAALLVLGAASPALAWGAQGHRYVGNLATSLLHVNAAAEVRAILGHDLDVSAVWADCIRDVDRKADGSFEWQAGPRTPAVCQVFGDDPAEKARMEDYARRNWTNCEYSGGRTQCHKAFHFTDVAIEHDRYDRSFYGTGEQDIVSAASAALLVLQDKPAPAPFDLLDKKEALLLLAHLIGDLHQPLHVGSIYLDETGARSNPDTGGDDPHATETRGGNSLVFGSDSNLHSDWDGIASGLGIYATPSVITAARAVPRTPGLLSTRPAKWASESVLASRQAFNRVSFGAKTAEGWPATFQDRPAYTSSKRQMQQRQLTRAGARLAELLNEIWP